MFWVTTFTTLSAIEIETSNSYSNYMPHDPIYIDGNDGFIVGRNGIVSGEGTPNNPYIIRDWEIMHQQLMVYTLKIVMYISILITVISMMESRIIVGFFLRM